MAECGNAVALVQATGSGGEWTLTVRFPDRASLADFRAAADELGVDLRVVHLYDLDEPKLASTT